MIDVAFKVLTNWIHHKAFALPGKHAALKKALAFYGADGVGFEDVTAFVDHGDPDWWKFLAESASASSSASSVASSSSSSSSLGELQRLECRVLAGGQKYRFVMGKGDEWPSVERRGVVPPEKLIVFATLVQRDGPARLAITARVRKYAGPNGDFFVGEGLRAPTPVEMFPWDDPDALRDRFSHVELFYASGVVARFDMDQPMH